MSSNTQSTNYTSLFEASLANPETFWAEQAEQIAWFKKPETVLGKDANGLDRWYAGGSSILAI